MKELLYLGVGIVAKIHNAIMKLNDAFEGKFTDKELHFLVIGLLGMAMIFVIYPLFKYLAKRNHEMIIAWIYVFTVIVVITFAIEIGQKITGTGNMEFSDIMFGLVGFTAMFLAFSAIRMAYHLILRLIKYWQKSRSGKYQATKAQDEETQQQ